MDFLATPASTSVLSFFGSLNIGFSLTVQSNPFHLSFPISSIPLLLVLVLVLEFGIQGTETHSY